MSSFSTNNPLQRRAPEQVSLPMDFVGVLADKEEVMADGVIISIIDDDESLRKAIKRLIKSAGLGVEDFSSAEDFLLSTRWKVSACLIVDIRLPGMSGLELQSKLAASDCRVPIIFISGHGDGLTRTRALESGAIDFLQKPFSEKALFDAINSSLVNYSGAVTDLPG